MDADGGAALVDVEDLAVRFVQRHRVIHAVNSVSFTVRPGEMVGVVGESGSGKTVTMMALLGLLPTPPAEVSAGRVRFRGEDLLTAEPQRLRRLQGNEIGVVFQDPMTSLNPVLRVGEQIREVIWNHDRNGSKADHQRRTIDLLTRVGVPDAERRVRQYPHEFSGGMRQRAMIAMAIANEPALLIADEPTTALDVTIQAQVIDVLVEAKRSTGAAAVLVTHDLGLVGEVTDRVYVMYAGSIVESGDTSDVFRQPSHPYTIGLLASRPSLTRTGRPLHAIPGQPPTLSQPPTGCMFRDRCPVGHDRTKCATETPQLIEVQPGHHAACHFTEAAAELAATEVCA